MPSIKNLAFVACIFLLTACSDSAPSQNAEQENQDFLQFDSSMIQALADKGETEKALEILLARDAAGVAKIADYILLAEIHNERLNGSAAESALDKADRLGATKQIMALQKARSLMLQLQFEAAQQELRSVIVTNNNGFDVLMMQGESAQALNDYERARGYFELAADMQPDNPEAFTSLALLALIEGQLDTARVMAETAISKKPDNNEANPYFVLGAVSRLNGDSEASISHLQTALERKPDHMLSQLELLGAFIDAEQISNAQEILDKILAESPDNGIAKFYAAYLLTEESNLEEAEEILAQERGILRTYLPAKRLYGMIEYRLGKYETAVNYLQQYLENVPGDQAVRIALAESNRQIGRPKTALELLQPELVSEEAKAIALSQAGAAQSSMGNYEAASELYSKAIALTKAAEEVNEKSLSALKAVYAVSEYRLGNYENAIATMKDATSSGFATSQQLTTLANMQMASGDFEGALASASKLKEKGDAVLGFNVEGAVQHRKQDFDAAIKAFSAALDINPDYPSALKNRAVSYINTKQFKLAKADLLRLEPQATGDGQFYGMLARVNLEMDNFVAAIDAFEEAIKIVPDSAEFHANYAAALGEKERYQEAIKEAEIAQKLITDEPIFTRHLQQMITRYKKAIEDLARAG